MMKYDIIKRKVRKPTWVLRVYLILFVRDYLITYKNEFKNIRENEISYTLEHVWPKVDSLCQLDKGIASPLQSYKLTYEGRVIENQNDTLGALALYQKAIEEYPENQYAQCGVGSILSDIGKDREALSYYEKALKLDPNYFIV